MVECPKCGTENKAPASAWTGGKVTKKPMKVQRFVCKRCGTSYASWIDSKTGEPRVMARKR